MTQGKHFSREQRESLKRILDDYRKNKAILHIPKDIGSVKKEELKDELRLRYLTYTERIFVP